MRAWPLLWFTGAVGLSACSLLVDTSGLHTDLPLAGPDANVADSAKADDATIVDAESDVALPDDAAGSCLEAHAWTVNGHCYFLLDPNTQPLAKSACVAAQAHLVTVTSAAEHEGMVAHVDRDSWIGLEAKPGTTDEADFSWITGEPKTVNYWAVADDGTGCVAFTPDGDQWVDRDCSDLYPALCERP